MTIQELRRLARKPYTKRRTHPVVARDADGVEHYFLDAQDAVEKGFARSRTAVYMVVNKREYVSSTGRVKQRMQLHNGYQWRYVSDNTVPWEPHPGASGRQHYQGKDHKASRGVVATFPDGREERYGSLREAARVHNIYHTAIFYAINNPNRRRRKHLIGMKWRYADEPTADADESQ